VLDVGYNSAEIARAIEKQIAHGRYRPNYLYGDGKAAGRIVDALATCEFQIQKRFVD
jgi:UDP-N-acetylglucosamine 2-epimerase